MDTLKIKATPLLKALGFKHEGGSTYLVVDEFGRVRFQARVFRRGDAGRFLEMHRKVYDADGEYIRTDGMLRDLHLDPPNRKETVTVYRQILGDLRTELHPFSNTEFLRRNVDYLLGLTDERVEG